MNELLPHPGGPWSRYPRLYGIPRSTYHCDDSTNCLTSLLSRSATPSARTTESSGRRRRGCPNCLHSAPHAVYTVVVPSSRASIASCASRRNCWKNSTSRPKVESTTDSNGAPELRSRSCFSRARSTSTKRDRCLKIWRPGEGTKENSVEFAPFARWRTRVCTERCCVRACALSQERTQG
eukprot:Amastigsp_a343922_8.p2 type:complete len:180 gc:universal Amastigsp_a343922_8:597-1136(+)